MDKFRWFHRDWAERSPEDVLRVTKEGLVKQRIQQFNRTPSIESLSQISEENCKMRRRTMGEVEMRHKLQSLSIPQRSSTITRPHSSYISNTRVSKIGSVQDLRYFPYTPQSINCRSSVCSPDPPFSTSPLSHTRVSRTDRFLKTSSFHESMTHLDLTPISIRPRTQTENSPSLHKELVSTKSLPLSTQTPSIILNIRKPSKSSESSDKSPSALLSPSPESTEKFTTRYISSPPPAKRRTTHLELNSTKISSFYLSPPPIHRPHVLDTHVIPESPTKLTDTVAGNSPDDSSNDDVFGSPDHTTCSLSTYKIKLLSSSDAAVSTDSQGSEEGTGRDQSAHAHLSKSPVRKPSLLRKKQGSRVERKKRTVTFTPEVLILQLCYEGKLKEIEDIIKDPDFESEYINTLGPMGITAMHQCALDGNVECLQALVTAGGNVDVVDAEHCTPLHSAAINNHFSAIRFLLIAGADPTRVDDDNKTAYDIASVERVRKVLKMAQQGSFLSGANSPSDNKEKSFELDSTSSDLSEDDQEVTSDSQREHDNSTDNSKGVSNIISNKRNSNMEDKPHQNREFMGIRLTNQKKEVALTQGAISEDDLSLTSSYSGYSGELSGLNSSCGNSDDSPCKSPMAFSTTALYSNTNSSVGTDLMERDNLASYDIGSDLEPDSDDFKFQEAVACQDTAAVSKILKEYRNSINVNRITRSDITALHHSVLEENDSLTYTLVSEGRADVNIRDRDGWTPLHAASAVGNLKIAKFLVENGARTSLWNSSGEFAVDVAEDDAMKRYLHSIMLGPHAIKKRFPTMLT
ncbi:Protein phosphatase 1 regulatory subunit 12A-like [Oopsacas minuta]|uniref:Protein phosphatase 1 regulatory subunit 12A-like n=1 Tax=Oopsacas minuta TaxID=111878 RepID=A0AAV7JXW2_9METZ|nr:Protein phosphatase 1 regulatory subunit 12A-like [Oopsacas minuta]